MTPLLQIKNLRKSYGNLEVLHGVSLEVAAGEVVAIIGASGSGKSTLLRCLNLLETPSGGEFLFDGDVIEYGNGKSDSARQLKLRWLRSQIGMVFQSFNLWPHKTVLENIIEAPIIVKGVARHEAIQNAEQLLGQIGLLEKRNVYPSRLSGGQQQRVAIVRSLAMKPKLMLFDEVTSSLDPQLVGEVLTLMANLARDGMTMLAVTHEMNFARSVSTRTIFVDQGVIAEDGPSHELFAQPRHARTRDFLSRVLEPINGGFGRLGQATSISID
jgi:ABC-type histidine transport system ATPase subunit